MIHQLKKATIMTGYLLIILGTAKAQVGIGNNAPHSSTVLDVNNQEAKGMLVPRLTGTQRNTAATAGAADGLLSYDESQDNFYYYRQNTWVPMSIPRGGIIMWTGTTAPDGWAICNGSQGTPDLRGRFIVGFGQRRDGIHTGPGVGTNYGIETRAGAQTVALTTSQIPAHNHSGNTSNTGAHEHDFEDIFHMSKDNTHQVSAAVGRTSFRPTLVGTGVPGAGDTDGDGLWQSHFNMETESDGNHSHSFTTGNTGGGGSHENRPPYYVLAFIMKL